MKTIKITETVLRDGHQSLIATRLKWREIEPILESMDQIGYHAIEMWGGATFDAMLRFLNEDPWQRLRFIKSKMKNTKLQMLLRGQNILGYHHYPDDVVKYFVERSIGNGIDIIRVFDALNDIRNMETAIKTAVYEGVHVQGAISYTTSPVHNIDQFVKLAKDLENLGVDSICIKDMSGILTPYFAFDLVKRIKSEVKLPIEIHSHSTTGLASMTYLKAIEAGADIIDTAISPFALGTSQPPTESLVATLNESEYSTGLDLVKLQKIADYFRPIRTKYIDLGLLNTKVLGANTETLVNQIPGGMISNLLSQLKQQNELSRFEEVLREVPRVRKDFGYPPLVTPTSQIVGSQAVLNVITGQPYKIVPKEVKSYIKGMYGRPTIPIKPEIVEKIIGEEEVITDRPADHLEPMLSKFREEIKSFIEQPEDILTYALFPDVALKFFKYREAEKYKIDEDLLNDEGVAIYPV